MARREGGGGRDREREEERERGVSHRKYSSVWLLPPE